MTLKKPSPIIPKALIYKIQHRHKNKRAIITPASSKSESNRVLIMDALSGKKNRIKNLSESDDTLLLAASLKLAETKSDKPLLLDSNNAGTIFRFLASYLSITKGSYILTCSDRMMKRPVRPLINALQQMGATISFEHPPNKMPLTIIGHPLKGKKIEIDGSQSSQFTSSLLLIAPKIQGGLHLKIKGEQASAPYLNMTVSIMKKFGAKIKTNRNSILVKEGTYKKSSYVVESDWSASSYWYECVALSEHLVLELRNYRKKSIQGDAILAKWMRSLGVKTEFHTKGIFLKKIKHFTPPQKLSFDLHHHPDLAPALFATCAALGIETTFTGIKNLRIKESDRVDSMTTELKKTGCRFSFPDLNTLIIHPVKIISKNNLPILTFQTHQDHRVAMALAPLSILYGSLRLKNPEVVSKSYPTFWKDFKKAGFSIRTA